ncbi:hypothetical protein L2E82_04874 [Cichorium intybus]|uniref:Uncharacterized protein n=1 Tax=Cichorium intybus TaxID=13427 RepID=A0ACB9H7H6_CICIN|nr:hypothetical protein L2E82_04874 [Cichorium intybus]
MDSIRLIQSLTHKPRLINLLYAASIGSSIIRLGSSVSRFSDRPSPLTRSSHQDISVLTFPVFCGCKATLTIRPTIIILQFLAFSSTSTEHEWELAQRDMEAASNGVLVASNELRVASVKAKSVSGFGNNRRLTQCSHVGKRSFCITLLFQLFSENSIVPPLESVFSKDVDAMTEAIHHSYHTKIKIKDACNVIKPVVPSLTFSVKGLHSMLTRLARTANIHAGNLHKAGS